MLGRVRRLIDDFSDGAAARAERERQQARHASAQADLILAQADAARDESLARAAAITSVAAAVGDSISLAPAGGLAPGTSAPNTPAFRGSGDYEAARRTRLDGRGPGVTGAADGNLDPQTLERLYERCGSAQRNDMVARAMVKRLVALLVQDGPGFEVTAKDLDYRTAAEAEIRRYTEEETIDLAGLCSMTDILGQCVTAACYRGATVVNIQDDGRVQLIERARLRNPGGAMNSPTLINGVELRNGSITAYHIAEWNQWLTQPKLVTSRLPATGAVLMRNPIDVAEGQITGEPALQAIIAGCDDLREFLRSTDIAARISTLFGAIITTPNPAAMQSALEAGTPNQPDRESDAGPKEIKMQQGMVQFAPMGTDVKQLAPAHPAMNHSAYVTTRLMLMGADIGLPVVLSHLDFTQVNFHSARSAVSVAWLGFMAWQGWLLRLCRRLIDQRLAHAIRAGRLAYHDDWNSYTLFPPPAPMLDYTSEVGSILDGVRGGVMSYRQATQRLGTGEWRALFDQLAIERAEQQRLGITPADLPGAQRPGDAAAPSSETTPAPADASKETDASAQDATQTNAAAPDTELQKTALNGAQVAALSDLTERVANGSLPIDSAIAIAIAAFPAVDRSIIDDIFNPLRGFKPTPEPAQASPAAAPPAP